MTDTKKPDWLPDDWDAWRVEGELTSPGTPQCDYCHEPMMWIAESYDPIRTLFICDKDECVSAAREAIGGEG